MAVTQMRNKNDASVQACIVIVRTPWLSRSDLHLSESQRVPAVTLCPVRASRVRRFVTTRPHCSQCRALY